MQASIRGARGHSRAAGAEGPCPIGRAAAVLGDYWTLVILRQLTLGQTRFDRLRQELGVSDNILAARLARLVDEGLLTRIPYRDARRTRHEYRLTEAGAATLPILLGLAAWGQEHTAPAGTAPPMTVLHTACGAQVPPGAVCASCGRPLERDAQEWLVPWYAEHPVAPARPAG